MNFYAIILLRDTMKRLYSSKLQVQFNMLLNVL